MSEKRTPMLSDALELARLLESTWPERTGRLRASGVPLNEATPAAPPAAAPASAEPPAGDPAGGAAEQSQTPAETPGVDYDRIEQMLESRFAEAFQPEPPPEPEPPDPYAALEGAYESPEQAQQARIVLEQMFSGVLDQRLGPIQSENQQLRAELARLTNELDAGELEERYPALQNPETARAVEQSAIESARQLGMQVENVGQVPAHLIEMAYLAQVGRERIASETPAGGANPGLESAGGATPPEPEPDIAQSIVNARGERTPAMKFWGA